MAWIRTGTVAVNNGSATVVGTGTNWRAQDLIGQGFDGPDGRTYEIIDVPANGQMTLATPYLGASATGQPYQIQPFRGAVGDLLAATNSLLGSFASVRDGIGAGLFPDGSAATPAYRFTNDQDTGIYRAGNNIFGIATGGSGRVFVDSSGNLGVSSSTPRGNLGIASNVTSESTVSLHLGYSPIDFYGFRIANTNTPSSTAAGRLVFQRGTGAAWVDAVTISNSGNLGIGIASPQAPLHAHGAAEALRLSTSAVRGNGGLFQTFHDASGRKGYVGYGASDDTMFVANEVDAPLFFITNNAVRLAVSNSSTGPGLDNAYNLGAVSARWATIFATTSTINTSDEREKRWRGELNAAELRAAKRIIGELGIYQWNDAVAEKGEHGARLHFGVRAQRAFQIMEEEGLEWQRYAWACHDQWEEQTEPVMAEVTVPKTRKAMRPSTLIDPATGQPAMVEVDEAYEETEMQPTGETRVTLEAGDRYGVRPDQLAFWLIAAQAAMQADLEGSIAILEARLASLEAA